MVAECEIKENSIDKVLIIHGKNDKVAGIELAHKYSETLGRYIIDVTLKTFEGGHQFPPSDLIAEIASWVIE